MLKLIDVNGVEILLEKKCHGCVNGVKTYAGGNKTCECPFCKGTGLILSENGETLAEFIKKHHN